MVDVIM